MKTFKIGLLGLGTVGSGTLNILQTTQDEIQRRIGHKIEVVVIAVRDLNRSRSVETTGIQMTDDPSVVVNHPEVDIVVELMGGTTLAKDLLTRAIENGKNIVTANKALIAECGNDLFDLADQHNVVLNYEASVAGGIPVIKAIREGLAGNKIEWLAGIINGTGNYILTEMEQPGAEFDLVLQTAQELGYAEADPTFDIEGIDAAHKLTILGSAAFGMPLNFEKTYTEGITNIDPQDIEFAKQLGYKIKHLGIADRTQIGVSLRVHPTLVAEDVLLANVDGVMNAVMVKGDHVGPTMYYGPGAGAGPTASAVIADVIDVIRAQTQAVEDRIPGLGFQADALQNIEVVSIEESLSSFYIRCFARDHSGVLAKITAIFAELNINIEQLYQEPTQDKPEDATLVMITNKVKEARFNQALAELMSMPEIGSEIQRIRVADLE